MRFNIFLGGLIALTSAEGVFARFLADSAPVTTLNRLHAERQATPTPTASSRTRTTLTPDPWECITENITQYFDVPQPTGNVIDAIGSYAGEVNKECLATAEGYERLSCVITDPKLWCGFTTAAPADILSSYSTYVSEVVSFWTAKSSTMSILATSCPVAWGRPNMADQEWLRIATAHAECYLTAHLQTQSQTVTTAPTATAVDASTSSITTTTTKSEAGILCHRQGLDIITLISVGLAVLANAA